MSNVNPKLTVGALAGIFAASILTNISFVTPDMLHVLGPWAPFVVGTTSSLLGLLVGVYKADTRAGTPTNDTPSDPVPTTLPDVARVLNLPASHLDAAGPGNTPTTFPAQAVEAVTPATPSLPVALTPEPAPAEPAPVTDYFNLKA